MPAQALDAPTLAPPPLDPVPTARHREGALTLMRHALGGPGAAARKLTRLVLGLATYLDGRRIRARLARLEALGHVPRVPTRIQLAVGSIDMLRFWISPAAADYYAQQGIGYGLHQVLRFLDDPLSLTDPLGFLSARDTIIGHLMQVVHANPVYDLQLLESFPDGLDALEEQLEQMLAGTHPRAASIGAIVEEPDYHARLLAFVRDWRRDPETAPLMRSNVSASGEWRALEQTFGQLPTTIRYFASLPTTLTGAARHLRRVRSFPGLPPAEVPSAC